MSVLFEPVPGTGGPLGVLPMPDIYPNLIDPGAGEHGALADGGSPAPRKEADPGAIEAAYESGMVNRGDIEIPMIDWRNYLEGELDMHN